MPTKTDTPMTTFRVRLPKNDVERARQRARDESQRLGRDISWAQLLRAALRELADGRVPSLHEGRHEEQTDGRPDSTGPYPK